MNDNFVTGSLYFKSQTFKKFTLNDSNKWKRLS